MSQYRLILRSPAGKQTDVISTVPTTLQNAEGEVMGMMTPDGKFIHPCETNVGKIVEVWDGFERTEMRIVWDGSVPEQVSRGTRGHSKGLLLDDYQVSGKLYKAIAEESHPSWVSRGRLKK